jgi:hypothetical protein
VYPEPEPVQLEPLESGLTLATGSEYMIFVAGRFDGSLPGGRIVKSGDNGVLWSFPSAPSDAALDALSGVRADRLLLFVPDSAVDDARGRYASWSGGQGDTSPALFLGEVATADLPGLLVLKTWLESRLIEVGWAGRVDIRVDGLEGSRLVIDGDPAPVSVVRSWIAELSSDGLEDAEYERVRAAAAGYFERARTDLQIILWQRAPQGAISPPSAFSRERFQEIAGIYFE